MLAETEFGALLQRVKTEVMGPSFANHVPFARLVRQFARHHDARMNPFFQVHFTKREKRKKTKGEM